MSFSLLFANLALHPSPGFDSRSPSSISSDDAFLEMHT